ncbi:SOLUTE CARRIER FAMILY 35 [Salix viminalis]|uniref:SOLUTE CARRIER FAMILY 35 n=1 Tax=Salix viminalis TaxID=40686 RepID=A0A9Q0SDT6_SALVM|nr:SOLUTE CARRIER FAMILY 35 [Salix viminalis]
MRGRYSRGKTVMLVKEEELWKNCCLLYSADFARLKAQSDMNNDHVLQGVGFSFPVCLSFIHYTLSWALMAILKAFSVLPASPSSKSSHLSLFTLGCVMSLSTGLANVSLKYNSVRFYQMAKIAVTPSIVLAEFIWFKKRASFSKVVAISVVSIGVAVATVTDLQFSLIGACVALTWIIPSAVNKILWSTLQQQDNWTALANTALILTSALLGFLLQWSGALALGATSAISHVVLGQFKTCVVLLGNFYIFGSNPGAISICGGAFMAIAGMSCYTYLNIHNPKPQTGKLSPGKSSTQSRLSKGNGKGHDGNGGESV